MLSSITPLGQRGRQGSWVRAVIGFLHGASLTAALVFGALGALGELTGLATSSPWLAIGVLVTAALLDSFGIKPPGPHRQVDEDWLNRYRDWVTGFAFGAQLGAGFTTIIPTWMVWALFILAVNQGIPIGIYVGVAFGFGRWVLLLATRGISGPHRLAEVMKSFASLESAAGRVLLLASWLTIGLVLVDVN